MKALSITLTAATLSTLLMLNVGMANADPARPHPVAGEKIDSGLGELPPYPQVVGEKVDSGLGELPPYPQVLGQKVDSGLGDLPHYRDWADRTGRTPTGAHFAKADTARR